MAVFSADCTQLLHAAALVGKADKDRHIMGRMRHRSSSAGWLDTADSSTGQQL